MEPTTVPVLCLKQYSSGVASEPGVTQQHLRAGCIANFCCHLLLSDVSILVLQDYVQFNMEWDPISFLPEVRELILPEFKQLDRQGNEMKKINNLKELNTYHLNNRYNLVISNGIQLLNMKLIIYLEKLINEESPVNEIAKTTQTLSTKANIFRTIQKIKLADILASNPEIEESFKNAFKICRQISQPGEKHISNS
jgi:hypothetical protein